MMTSQTSCFGSNYPRPFPPPWAVAWGDDQYGLWAEAEFGGRNKVVQRLRWIAPGNFVMGSPEDELQRLDNEGPQHSVFISQGFWLADTACTQALWLAVMGENPGYFQDPIDLQRPVEKVSWPDVQEFLRKLGEADGLSNMLSNALPTALPTTLASLPTEAEWEYACRARTISPFSFGNSISSAQVNFDGNFPYAGGEKSKYRQLTVPVRHLPANRWGLYQMHGNVWEWCADTMREYTLEAQYDPGLAQALKPVENPDLRVLRGGSWIGYAQFARSAYRYHSQPGRRASGIGFRFALRSSRLASRV